MWTAEKKKQTNIRTYAVVAQTHRKEEAVEIIIETRPTAVSHLSFVFKLTFPLSLSLSLEIVVCILPFVVCLRQSKRVFFTQSSSQFKCFQKSKQNQTKQLSTMPCHKQNAADVCQPPRNYIHTFLLLHFLCFCCVSFFHHFPNLSDALSISHFWKAKHTNTDSSFESWKTIHRHHHHHLHKYQPICRSLLYITFHSFVFFLSLCLFFKCSQWFSISVFTWFIAFSAYITSSRTKFTSSYCDTGTKTRHCTGSKSSIWQVSGNFD